MQPASMECPGMAFTLKPDSKPGATGSLPTTARAHHKAFMKVSESGQDTSLQPTRTFGIRTNTDLSLFLL